MDINNSLNKQVFGDDIDFKNLENILESLNHVIPRKISRQEFKAKIGNFLVETGEDKFGKHYDLFLPDDLVYGELLFFIDFLSKKFGIENYTPFSRILTQAKVMVGVILRGLGEKKGEEELRSLAEKYNISQEFVERILGQKLKYSNAKEIIGNIKAGREEKTKQKIGENKEDISLGFEDLKDLFGEEFDLTFFRKGINMLRLGMMTITQAEQEAQIIYCEENGYKKEFLEDGGLTYEKGSNIIYIKVKTEDLDEKERLLRYKIGIDNLKIELENARKTGNQEIINNLEYKATNLILKNLFEYLYKVTKNEYGYQPNKISEFKEIYCVGFSLLGHAFLSELGIEHNGLNIPEHIALEVIIGLESYYFDPSMYGILHNLNEELKYLSLVSRGDTEKILLSGVYNNKGVDLKELERYNEAIKCFDKAIALNPNNSDIYYNKGIVLNELGKIKLSKLYSYTTNLLNGKEIIEELYYKEEKEKITNFIEKKDFEGLRLYLLELEKEEN